MSEYAEKWKKGIERLRPVLDSEWFKQEMRDFVWRNSQ